MFGRNVIETCYNYWGVCNLIAISILKVGIKEKWYPELGTQDAAPIRGTRDPVPGTRGPGPISGTRDPGPIDRIRKSGPLRGTRDVGPSTWDPFWNIHTPILAICHMKDYMERNNFDPKNPFWKWPLHVLNCVWKVCHKNITFKREKLYEKVID